MSFMVLRWEGDEMNVDDVELRWSWALRGDFCSKKITFDVEIWMRDLRCSNVAQIGWGYL